MPKTCLCFRCPAKCCRYLALQIDPPKRPEEYENVRWLVSHEDVFVFIEEGKWYVHLSTKCDNLRPDNRCGIYETRPRICREYSWTDCDFTGANYEWEAVLARPAEVEAYARRKLGGFRAAPLKAERPEKAEQAERAEQAEKAVPSAANSTAHSLIPLSMAGSTGHGHRAWDGVFGTFEPNPPERTHEIAVPIDAPGSAADLEDARWYVMHDRIRIRIHRDRWTLLYRTRPQAGADGHPHCRRCADPLSEEALGASPTDTTVFGPPAVFGDEPSLVEFAHRHFAETRPRR